MRLIFALLALPCLAQELTVERLFTRPFLWGTEPEKPKWAKKAPVLGFLWNAEGRRFKDLYAYNARDKKLARLTDLEREPDELNRTEEEKDERRRNYLMPAAGIADYQLSQDGSRAIFSYRGDLYIVYTAGGKPPFRLTRTKTSETNPIFSPDASKIAFLRDKQLYVQSLSDGQLTQVSEIDDPESSLTDFRWSPDGKRFVLVVRKGKTRQMPLPNYSGRFVTANPFPRAVAGEEPSEALQYIVPAAGGKAIPLGAGPYGAKVYRSDPPEWSPDSKFLIQRVTHPQMKKLAVLCFDAETGKAAVVTEESDGKWVYGSKIGWAPDSKRIFFTSERDGWAHLYVVPASGGTAVQVTKGTWEIHPEPTFMFDPQWVGEFLYYSSTESGTSERQFYKVRPDGSGKERLSEGEGLNLGLVSADSKHIAWKRADLKNPIDLWVDGNRVTTSPLPRFYQQWWPETRFVTFPSAQDGKPVAAKILLPRGYRPEDKTQKPRPAVFFIHGSGYATSVLKQWGSYQDLRYAFNCYLASKGYVVLDMDYRGSSGYGREWRTDVYLHLGGPDLEDVLGGVEYLRKLGNIDMKRLGLWGVSYGGFMTNMAMFRAPEVFRAGSSWAAVNDWENYNPSYTTQRLNTPQSNPEAYKRSSPITFSGGLKNRLLLIHGMGDSNVLFQDTVQLAEKLIHEGKDFGQAYYPQEDHGFVRDETLVDAFRRTAEWFERYLGQ